MAFYGEILEIFSWLPAKSLLKFSSTCNACKDYVSDPFFIKKQNRNMQLKGDSSFFVQPNSCQRFGGNLEFHTLPGEENSDGVPNECVKFMKTNGRVLASSNGLVCCRNISNQATMNPLLFICNPATRSLLGIPSPANLRSTTDKDLHIFFQCNIELYDQFPHDYLLMLMEYEEDWSNTLSCKIYVPQKEIWLEAGHMDSGGRNLLFESGVYQGGTIYFLSDWSPCFAERSPFYWPYVVAFNLEEGKSRFLKVPKESRKGLTDRSCRMCIFSWEKENSICLVKLLKGVLIVWVLRDFNSGSWDRILKIRGRAMRMVELEPIITGFTVLKGSMLIVTTTKRVYRYDLTGDWKSRRARNICRHQCGGDVLLSLYSSTLRPCGDGASVLHI
ncbi:hypothetical protein RHSIM_Rhsim01G0262200 [Rhododendron simsii]|uniref:F-box protein n=1 Tax=Rhododendron simsii TaxID=118357 RepID=A0A834LYN2_RHOSS|nr:hypothetical protein RHSIM_Rhsim01G0262200 [Rhododendron simsii]